jgi:exodeoxyribonuclease VII small subunit
VANNKLTFEQALAKLEQIVSAIESGQIGLEESIEKYAEGARLINYCRGVLNAAEKKIQLLTAKADGSVEKAGELAEPTEPPEA